MPKINENTDPYAPPPMYHDRSGGVVRVALLGGLLGAAALGFAWMSSQETAPLVPEVAQEQQVADAGYQVSQNTLPESIAEPTPPAPVAPQTSRRSPEPAQEALAPDVVEQEAAAPPEQVEPVSPAPLPPSSLPPMGSVG